MINVVLKMTIQQGLFLVITAAGFVCVQCGIRHQYGELGSTVTLTCKIPEGHEGLLVWKHDGEIQTPTPSPTSSPPADDDIDDDKYNDTSSSTDYDYDDDGDYDEYDEEDEVDDLILTKVNMSSRGIYTCHVSPTTEPLDEITLVLGYPPAQPNITCQSFDYPESFQCEWRPGRETFLNTSYSASYTNPQDCKMQECPATGPLSCRVHHLVMFSTKEYGVEVVATNALGSASGVISFDILDIIMPDPPENVTAERTCSSAIRVTWRKPHRWTRDGAFFLTYKLKISTPAGSRIEINVPEDDIKLITCHPVPTLLYDLPNNQLGIEHHVQMSAVEGFGNGLESRWSEPVSVPPVTGPSCPVVGTPTPTATTQSLLKYRDSLTCVYEEEEEEIMTTTEETTTTTTAITTTADTNQRSGDGGQHPAFTCILIPLLSILLLR